MRKVRARLGSILLSLAMLLSLLPVTAFAEEVDAYTALKAAVEAAPTNGTQTTVTLTGDITDLTTDQILEIKAGQNIVLNMDGHSITVASNFAGRPILNHGTLTVTGNGTIDSSASNTGGYGAIDNYGTLTIQNGTYTGSVNASGASIKNRFNGVLTIEDGIFNGAATAIYNEGITKIYDGLFDCRSCSACNRNSWGYTIQSHKNSNGSSPELYFYDGTVIGVQGAFSTSAGYSEIHGGTFKTVSCEKHANGSSAWYALYIAGEDEDVKCVVYDGYFESVSKTTALIGNDNTGGDGGINADATIEIKGGTFVAPANQNAVTGAENTGNPIITGGTFSSNVSKYVADGCVLVPQGDQWVVGSLDDVAVAQIDGQKYASLAGAIEAVQDGGTVTLIRNSVLLDRIMITDKTFTLDMNGYTIILGANATEINAIIELSGNSDVTVAGNGEITFNDSYMEYNDLGYIFRLEDNAKLTIENGNYHAGLTCVQVGNNATAIIKDGSFSTYATWEGKSWLLNKIDGSASTFLVYGGTFKNYDPANSDTEDPTDNFCAPGYVSVKDGDTYTVMPLEKVAVAQIGDTYYLTLAEAVEAAKDNDTIELLKTTEGGGVQVKGDGRHITIDLNGFTYTVINPTVGSTGTKTNGFQLLKGTDVTFKNGTIKPGTSDAKILIQNYCNLTLDNVIIDCSGSNCQYVSSNNCGNVVIKDSKIIAAEGQRAFDLYYWPSNRYTEGVSVTVEGDSEISGIIEYGSDGSEAGKADLFEKAILTIKSGKFAGGFSTYNLGADGKANISITGGVFSSDPSAYLASGYAAVDNSGDTVYQYKVVPAGQNPAQVVTGDADISVSDSITNADEKALAEEVANALNSDKEPDIGEALKAAAGTVANQNTVTKEQGKDALTNAGVSVTDTSNVTIVVQPYLEISVAAVSIQGSTKTVTLDITPMYITVATTNKDNIDLKGSNKNAVQIGTAHELTITKPVTVTIPLTTGFVNDGTLYVKHVKDNGSTYYYKGSVKDNVLTFTNPNGFSLFTYSTSSDEVVAAIGDHGYATLADAIAAVEKGGTIELLADNLSATVSREISFTVTGNGADTVRLSAGSGYKMQQVGNTYTFTYIGTEGGGSSTSGYLVSVDSGKNGKVTVSPQRAEKGETVTITVKPDEGYELDELTVTDKNGDSVKVTYKDDNKYTFKMPGSSVTVEATFQAVKEESPVDAFLDINTAAWYYDAVKYVVENGLMSGTGTYTFEPNTTLSRGMIAQMLYALEGKPSVSATNSFTDVSANDWYAKAASWAQSKGIITGYDDGRFAPNDPLTREQLALILYNYAQSKGYDTSAKADLSKYVDGSSTSAWAQTAMTWAVGEGLLSGRGLNMLYPTGTATRAEVAQIMMNFCENTAK